MEKITKVDGSKQVKRTIGGVAIITLEQSANSVTQSQSSHYLYKDHLGSLDVITDHTGAIVQEQSFDAWGLRRNAIDWQVLSKSILMADFGVFSDPITTRGFTGHEMVDEVGIIHMNGRIYDPKLARFLQADPFVQEPFNTQSLNRYSYGFNNPLNGTDPSGYSFFKKVAGIIVGAVGTYLCGLTCGAWAYAAIGAAAGATSAAVNGGNILEGALIGAVSAAAFNGIGDVFAGCTSCAGDFVGSGMNASAFSGKVFAHGLVGGAGSVLQGGKFGHGFASAGVTQSFASKIGRIASGARFSVGRIAAAAIVGGTASRLSGGKFANGATTGAFSRMFNDEAHYQRDAQQRKWVTVRRIHVNKNSPVGDPRTVTLSVDRTVLEEGPLDTAGRLVEPAINAFNDGLKGKLAPLVSGINQKIANMVGTSTYATVTRTLQNYQKYNATLTVWDESLVTGETRWLGQTSIVQEVPVGKPYTQSNTY